MSDAGSRYVTVTLNDLVFGIDVAHVREIIRTPELTPVAGAHACCLGLLGLRGHIVAVFDLYCSLASTPPGADQETNVVILEEDDSLVGFRVGCVGDVVDVSNLMFESPPSGLPAATQALLVGVCQLEDTLLHVLDTESLFGIEQ